jgi:hypothetical protein
MPHYTNKVKILSPLLAIAYSDNKGTRTNYPTKAQTDLLLNGAAAARRIMRTAVAEMDRVVYLRRPEGEPFTSIMNYHFGLAANRLNPMLKSNVVDKSFGLKAVAQKDRRWILNKVRMGMLSISFHLNTGVYLIDVDIGVRNIIGGVADTPGAGEEGYVVGGANNPATGKFTPHCGLLSGFRNGEIHVAFAFMQQNGYTAEAVARVIIHEASHKYWGVADYFYAHQTAGYRNLNCVEAVDNADSFAWAAVSLDQGALVHGTDSNDLHHQAVLVP